MKLAFYARWYGEKEKSLRNIRKIEWEISFYNKVELCFVMKKKIIKKIIFFRLYKIRMHYEFMFQKKLN